MIKALHVLAPVLIAALTWIPPTKGQVLSTQKLDALIATAKNEGELDLVTPLTGGQAEIDAWIEGYTKLYGYRPNVNVSPTADMPSVAARVVQERQAGRTSSLDVVIGSEAHVLALARQAALQKIDWSDVPNVKPDYVQADGRAVMFLTIVPGVTYNADRVKTADVPHTTEAFVNTKYPIATTAYGADLDVLASPEAWGEEKTIAFVKKLSAKASGLISCAQLSRLLTGEFDLFGLDCGNATALAYASRGAPLRSTMMTDAPILSYLYLTIPEGARHPASAELWINYLLSRDGQDALYRFEFCDLDRVPDSKAAANIEQFRSQGVKFIQVDYAFAARNADNAARLRHEFQQILQKR